MAKPWPRSLGRYELLSELGRGMMGVVYRARDPELDRALAIKVILAKGLKADEVKGYEQRFIAEARAAAALSHPAVVVVHDVGRDPGTGTFFIAFEYLEGTTLDTLVEGGRPLDWRAAVKTIARVADALHHAHSRGVVHRDIKPSNIMVLPSGEPKIMDFGIAKLRTSELTAAGELFGTPRYMSPEQAAGATVDGRSDLFALGSVFYLALTGRPAFPGEEPLAIMKLISEVDPPPPSGVVPGLPAALDDVIARALAKDPNLRYGDGRELADDLEDVLADREPRSQPGVLEAVLLDETPPPMRVRPPGPDETHDLRPGHPQRRHTDFSPPPDARAGGGLHRYLIAGAGGLAAFALAALLLRPGSDAPAAGTASAPAGEPAPAAPAPPVTAARLELVLQHALQAGGQLRIWADDALVLDTKLQFARRQQVREAHSITMPPGDHVLKVEVRSGSETWINRIEGSFPSGDTRQLEAVLRGAPGGSTLELMPLS